MTKAWPGIRNTRDAGAPGGAGDVVRAFRDGSVKGYVWLISGAAIGLMFALPLIHFTAGLGNYRYWTITFASARRAPSFGDMLSDYDDHRLWWCLTAVLTGVVVLWRNTGESQGLKRIGNRIFTLLAVCFLSIPFAWPVIYLFIEKDASERAERLLTLWPLLLIIAFVFAVLSMRRRNGFALILPFVLIGTIHGAFLSQQLWGSTYALWPLLMLLAASAITAPSELLGARYARAMTPLLAGVIAVSLLIAGSSYVVLHERLDYVNLEDGNLVRSTLPALRGLSVRGSWIPDFEELVRYAEKEIPKEDGILMIPGEDLFYYTTGRRPRFPVLMFDHTVNPFSPEEIVEQARLRDIRWLVIKEETQLDEDPLRDLNKDRLLKLLSQDFKQVESLNNYEIYRRKTADDKQDEEDNDDRPDGEESDNPSPH